MQKPGISREVWFQIRDAIYEALERRHRAFADSQNDVEIAKRIVHEAMMPRWTAEGEPTAARAWVPPVGPVVKVGWAKPGTVWLCKDKNCRSWRYGGSCVQPGFDGRHCPLGRAEVAEPEEGEILVLDLVAFMIEEEEDTGNPDRACPARGGGAGSVS